MQGILLSRNEVGESEKRAFPCGSEPSGLAVTSAAIRTLRFTRVRELLRLLRFVSTLTAVDDILLHTFPDFADPGFVCLTHS